MYKEMIPADVIARRAAFRPAEDRANERPTIQLPSPSEAGGATDQPAAKEWQERCLRLAADFDNFKKRTARENERRASEQKNALVRDLLPAVDNLERALSDGSAQSMGQLREGVELTLRQLTGVLNQHGFTSRNDLGRPFDPQFHEAACVGYESMCADHAILEVWQRGWMRGKELFRPAKVVVNELKRSNAAAYRENIQEEKGAHHG